MRKKIYNIFNKIYGVLMSISFFGGVLPLIPFIFAIIVGGDLGEKIALFLYNDYYPWIIISGSVAIVFGVIAMYVGKIEGLSVKSVSADNQNDENK